MVLPALRNPIQTTERDLAREFSLPGFRASELYRRDAGGNTDRTVVAAAQDGRSKRRASIVMCYIHIEDYWQLKHLETKEAGLVCLPNKRA